MSSLGSPTLDLDVRSRRAEPLLVWLTLALAIIAPALMHQVDVSVRLMLMTLGGAMVAGGFWRSRWWGSRRLVSILWLSDGRWRLTPSRGPALDAQLLPDSRLGPGCVWLHWRCERKAASRSLDLTGQLDRGLSRRWSTESLMDCWQLAASHSQTHAMVLVSGDLPAAHWRRLRVRLALDPGVWPAGRSPTADAEGPGNYNTFAKFSDCLSDCRRWVGRLWQSPLAPVVNPGRRDCEAVAVRPVSGQP